MLATALAIAVGLHLSADTVSAGDRVVRAAALALQTTTKRMVLEDSSGSHVLGTLTQTLSRVTIAGRSGLLSVQTFEFGGKRTVDSSFADARTLRPILHRSHNESRVMTLDFDAARVVGAVTPSAGERKAIDQVTAVPTFDSNIADLVYAALPLAEGYAATVPTYVYEEGGLVWSDVSVRGDAPVDGQPVWRVHVHSAKRDVDYWVARKSHTVLRSRYQVAPGRVLRIELSTR
jgi:hypothetical protein